MVYLLALGSNLGDKLANLQTAVYALQKFGKVIKPSRVYQTSPENMLPGSPDFLNMALQLDSNFLPGDLLKTTKIIEKQMGRDPKQTHNKSRIIDIDILFAEDLVQTDKELTIPHPSVSNRAFVLLPLCDINPDFIHPVMKKTMGCLLSLLRQKNPTLNQSISEYGKLV